MATTKKRVDLTSTVAPKKSKQAPPSFLQSKTGKAVAITLSTAALALAAYSMKSFFGTSDAESASATRWFIDSTTLQPFQHTVKVGEPIPVPAPSGGNTGYEAELCYWTKDGGIKTDPTPVLLNSFRGLPEPTFCPDCGRLVVGHNPAPRLGEKPPPTEAEYMALHPVRQAADPR